MQRLFLVGSIVVTLWSLSTSRVYAADDNATVDSHRISVGGFWIASMATVSYRPTPLDIASQQWNGGGATLDVAIGRRMSIDTRAMWNRKGAKLTFVANSALQDVRADYLSIPVLFKAGTTGPLRVYAAGGPEVSVRLAARVVSTLSPDPLTHAAAVHAPSTASPLRARRRAAG